jgi:hypothetical protein
MFDPQPTLIDFLFDLIVHMKKIVVPNVTGGCKSCKSLIDSSQTLNSDKTFSSLSHFNY